MSQRTEPDPAEDVTLMGTHGRTGGDDRPEKAELARGASIGRYIVLERIGVGGMGIVYSALDPDLGRKVAIKLVRGESADAARTSGPRTAGAARLLREAQAMARLHHANVITVYDVGTLGDSVFIAMEYLDGGTLHAWLDAAPRRWTEIIAIFRAAGAGLVAAHAAGLVHRDFKPDNVLLGTEGRVCVVDFGISRTANDPSPTTVDVSASSLELDELRLTRTGALVGTPAYMAPEQHTGGTADARSDQFAFCVALYEALYRQRPFEGGNAAQLAANVIDGRVRRPDVDATPGWLWPIVARGLAVDPAARHPDVAALLAALADDPALRRRRRLRRVGVAALGVAAVAGAATMVRAKAEVCSGASAAFAEVWNDGARERGREAFAATGRAHAPHAWSEAAATIDAFAEAWVEAHTGACRATAVLAEQSQELLDRRMACFDRRRREVEAVVELFATADRGVVDSTSGVLAQIGDVESCNDTAALLDDGMAPPGDPVEAEAIRTELGRARVLRTAARDAAASDIVDGVAARVQALGYPPVHAEWLHVRASIAGDRGQADVAEAGLYEAATAAAACRHLTLEPPIWIGLVRVIGTQADRPLELPPIIKAAEIAVARAGNRAADRGSLAATIGLQAVNRGDYAVAEVSLREAIAIFGELRGMDHPDTLESRELLALVHHGQRRYDEAEAELTAVAGDIERTLQATHPRMGTVVGNLGRVQAARGDLVGALAAYERAQVALVASFGPDHQVVATNHANLATTLRKLGRYDEATENIDRALAIERKLFGPESPRIADNIHGRAQVAMARKRPELALPDYKEALRIWEATLGPKHVRLAYALVGIGKAELAIGGAVDTAGLERALALRAGNPDVAAGDLADTRFQLARALRVARLDPARATTLAQQARDAFATLHDEEATAEIAAWLAPKPNGARSEG